MPKRKRVFTQSRVKAQRDKAARGNETEEERERRLASEREYSQRMRVSQSEIERESIREVDRARKRVKRYRETVEQKQIRNEESRKRIKVLPENRQVEAQEQNTSVNAIEERRRRNYNFENEAFRYDPTKEYSKHPSVVTGKKDKICEFCGAKKFKGETLSMCCKGGKVKLSSLQVPPPELFSYMSGETPESQHFLQNIRRYNACFQMTSFGATCVHEKDVFKVQGQIYHKVG